MSADHGEDFNWRCPSCHLPLTLHAKQWRCEHNHCFDCAKEGYVNLLLAQHKKSQEPGDSKAMINARREFLGQGFYAPLAQYMAERLADNITVTNHLAKAPIVIADAGCGEGFYLRSIAQYFEAAQLTLSATGIDISKPAIQKAAKRSPEHNYAVASCFDIPLPDNSQHAVIQVFAPSSEKEINRILDKNGIWLEVNPASEHLFELKQFVYDSPQQHVINTQVPEGFALVSQTDLKFPISLSDETQRLNLLMMTPFYWHLSEDKKSNLLKNLKSTHAHFDIRVLRKTD